MDMSTSGAGTVHFQGLTSAAVALALACGRPAFVTKAQIQLGRQDGGDPKPKPQTLSPKAVAVQTWSEGMLVFEDSLDAQRAQATGGGDKTSYCSWEQ